LRLVLFPRVGGARKVDATGPAKDRRRRRIGVVGGQAVVVEVERHAWLGALPGVVKAELQRLGRLALAQPDTEPKDVEFSFGEGLVVGAVGALEAGHIWTGLQLEPEKA